MELNQFELMEDEFNLNVDQLVEDALNLQSQEFIQKDSDGSLSGDIVDIQQTLNQMEYLIVRLYENTQNIISILRGGIETPLRRELELLQQAYLEEETDTMEEALQLVEDVMLNMERGPKYNKLTAALKQFQVVLESIREVPEYPEFIEPETEEPELVEPDLTEEDPVIVEP